MNKTVLLLNEESLIRREKGEVEERVSAPPPTPFENVELEMLTSDGWPTPAEEVHMTRGNDASEDADPSTVIPERDKKEALVMLNAGSVDRRAEDTKTVGEERFQAEIVTLCPVEQERDTPKYGIKKYRHSFSLIYPTLTFERERCRERVHTGKGMHGEVPKMGRKTRLARRHHQGGAEGTGIGDGVTTGGVGGGARGGDKHWKTQSEQE